jgi:hypothetical protein
MTQTPSSMTGMVKTSINALQYTTKHRSIAHIAA